MFRSTKIQPNDEIIDIQTTTLNNVKTKKIPTVPLKELPLKTSNGIYTGENAHLLKNGHVLFSKEYTEKPDTTVNKTDTARERIAAAWGRNTGYKAGKKSKKSKKTRKQKKSNKKQRKTRKH